MTKKLKPIGWAVAEASKQIAIGSVVKRISEEFGLFEPLPEPPPAAQETRTHKTQTRTNDLGAVIMLAKRNAVKPNDTSSVWAALVQLAELPIDKRPAPIIGVEENEGKLEIRYQAGSTGEIKFFTRAALADRLRRARANTR